MIIINNQLLSIINYRRVCANLISSNLTYYLVALVACVDGPANLFTMNKSITMMTESTNNDNNGWLRGRG